MDYTECYEIHWKKDDGDTGVDRFDTLEDAQMRMRFIENKHNHVRYIKSAVLFRMSTLRVESFSRA